MILSHRYRFIFIKTLKTAGTSIEIALSRHCGPDDIITPISQEDEGQRSAEGVKPRNYIGSGTPAKPDFFNHMGGTEIRDRVESGVWQTYYKFCVERNPWERFVSKFYFRTRNEPNRDIDSFVTPSNLADLRERGSDLYFVDGEVGVDRIIRYENLDAELEEVRTLLGIPEPLQLPKAKGGYRLDRRGYEEQLTDRQIAQIAEYLAREIDLLGYVPLTSARVGESAGDRDIF